MSAATFTNQLFLLGTTPVMRVQREEIFGLAANIWTHDISKALRLAQSLDAGAVWVNCTNVFDPNLPFGGFKESGWGRELGQEGVEGFTELKAITVKL